MFLKYIFKFQWIMGLFTEEQSSPAFEISLAYSPQATEFSLERVIFCDDSPNFHVEITLWASKFFMVIRPPGD